MEYPAPRITSVCVQEVLCLHPQWRVRNSKERHFVRCYQIHPDIQCFMCSVHRSIYNISSLENLWFSFLILCGIDWNSEAHWVSWFSVNSMFKFLLSYLHSVTRIIHLETKIQEWDLRAPLYQSCVHVFHFLCFENSVLLLEYYFWLCQYNFAITCRKMIGEFPVT